MEARSIGCLRARKRSSRARAPAGLARAAAGAQRLQPACAVTSSPRQGQQRGRRGRLHLWRPACAVACRLPSGSRLAWPVVGFVGVLMCSPPCASVGGMPAPSPAASAVAAPPWSAYANSPACCRCVLAARANPGLLAAAAALRPQYQTWLTPTLSAPCAQRCWPPSRCLGAATTAWTAGAASATRCARSARRRCSARARTACRPAAPPWEPAKCAAKSGTNGA